MSIALTKQADTLNLGEAAYGGPRSFKRAFDESDYAWSQRCSRERAKFHKDWDQRRQNEADDAMEQWPVIKVRGLTPNQLWLIEDELCRVGEYAYDARKTTFSAKRGLLFKLAEGLESTWPDDEELAMRIECNAMKDLTEAQVAFGVKQTTSSMRITVKKILAAARKV